MLWRVGDGKQIEIFEDRWLPGEEPTKVISPSNTISTERTISKLLNSDGAGWNAQLVDSMFLPFEAQRIKDTPICVTNQEDCVSWPKCRTGLYSVKFGYQLLCEAEASCVPSRSMDRGAKLFWKHIWRIKLPNKIKVFLWQACSNALPTKVGLHKRKVVDNKICEQCLKGDEDEVHVVWGCECIQSVWEDPFAAVRLKYPRMDTM